MRVRSFTRTAISAEDTAAIRAADVEGHLVIFEPWPGRYRMQLSTPAGRYVGTGLSVRDALASVVRQAA